MPNSTQVVVKGGGKNLYEVSESSGWFYVYRVDVSLLLNHRRNLGKTRTFDQALSLIKSHSGKAIERIG